MIKIDHFNFLKEKDYSNKEVKKVLGFLSDRTSNGVSDKRIYKYLL